MTTYNYQLNMGSVFSGIGGFELGIEAAMPFVNTVWQCEQNTFCQKVLKRHWPNATIHDDVRNITTEFGRAGSHCTLAFDPVACVYADDWQDTPAGIRGARIIVPN